MNSDAQTNFLGKRLLEIVPQNVFSRTVITAAGNYFSAQSRKKNVTVVVYQFFS